MVEKSNKELDLSQIQLKLNQKRELFNINYSEKESTSIKSFADEIIKHSSGLVSNDSGKSSEIIYELSVDNKNKIITIRKPKEEPFVNTYFKTRELIHPFFTKDGEENLLNYFPHSPYIVKKENTPNKLSTDLLIRNNKIENQDNYSNENEKVKILIFTPHQDDEVLGAATLINKLVLDNISFKVVYMTSGKGGGNAELRKNEAKEGLKVLGGKEENCLFYDFPFYNKENREVTFEDYIFIDNILKQYSPDSIFICSDVFDPNLTHKKCYDILLTYAYYYDSVFKINKINNFSEKYKVETLKEICKENKLIYKEILEGKEIPFKIFLYYSVWYWPKENEVTHILFYDYDQYRRKVCAMMEHMSQIENKFMGADDRPFYERSTHRDKWFGNKYGEKYCEIFYLINN